MKRFAVFTLVSLLALPAFLFQPDTPAASTSLEITGVNAAEAPTITVTVDVKDSVGQTVRGLTLEDFHLNGRLAEVARIVTVQNVTEEDLPFATVLVIDTSSSMAGPPLERTIAAARDFISRLGPNDQVAVMSFNTDVRVDLGFTTDKNAALAAVDALQFGGQTALYDAAVDGIELAAQAPFPRRTMILLSDGAEYGGASVNPREAGPDLSPVRGVPVYTIGLGFGTDRSYLEALAESSSARFYESPSPDDLEAIYTDLSALFRSQYILTLEFDAPLDGTIYPFTLQAQTDAGVTNIDAATVRAPIPTPIVSLSPIPTAPLAAPVTFLASVAADQALTSVDFSFAGQSVSFAEPPFALAFDPFTVPPGDYIFDVTATDVDGDAGHLSVPVTVAAIPARITLSADLQALGAIREPVNVQIDVESQTEVQEVDVRVDGAQVAVFDAFPADFVLDPFLFAPGTHSIEFVARDASGAEGAVSQTMEIAALPPRITLSPSTFAGPLSEPTDVALTLSSQTEITEVAVTLAGETTHLTPQPELVFTLDPARLTPGAQRALILVTDSAGTTGSAALDVQIAALPPVVSIDGLADGQVISGPFPLSVDVSGQSDQADIRVLADGREVLSGPAPLSLLASPDGWFAQPGSGTITVDVVNAFDQRVAVDFAVEIDPLLFPTPTPTPSITPDNTQTADALAIIAQATANAVATADAGATAAAQSTAEFAATSAAQATADAEATGFAAATQAAQSTVEAQATADAQATTDAQATVDAQAALNAEASAVAELTLTAAADISIRATQEAQATLETAANATTQARELAEAAATSAALTALAVTRDAEHAEQTAVARQTAEAQITADAADRATAQAEMALLRQATADALATTQAEDAAATAQAATAQAQDQATAQAAAMQTSVALTEAPTTPAPVTATPTVEPTTAEAVDPTATDTESPAPTDTPEPVTATATVEAVEPTPTVFDPTSTPGELTDVIAQGTQAPENSVALIAVIAGTALLLLILVIVLAARRRRQ